MGNFTVEAAISRVGTTSPSIPVSLVAGTGATYTTLPDSLLRGLEVEPGRQLKVRLADHSVVDRGLAFVSLRLVAEDRSLPSAPVVSGDENVYLLDAVTLEEASLAADPLHKRLVPAEGLLLSIRCR